MKIELATMSDYKQVCACDPVAATHAERREEIAHAIAARACYVVRKDDIVVVYCKFVTDGSDKSQL